MKKSYRLVLISVFLIAVVAGLLQARVEKERSMSDLRLKLASLGLGLQEIVGNNLTSGQNQRLAKTLRQFSEQEHMSSAVVCSTGKVMAMDQSATQWTGLCGDQSVLRTERDGSVQERKHEANGKNYLLYAKRIESDRRLAAAHSIVLVHSLADVEAQTRNAFFRAMVIALATGLVAFVIFELLSRWFLRRSLQILLRWTRSIFKHEHVSPRLKEVEKRLPEEFRELTRELSTLALKMRQERLKLVWNAGQALSAIEADETSESDPWAELRTKVREVLKNRQLVIVANRQPYSHEKRDGDVHVVRPASGVVTALEPIMRLCGGGVWVGHGSGSADREVVDANDEVAVPPENPTYKLRRVWLTKEEENGYYYGFSNEGLWPLCHLAYTRPTFRISDWETYQSVNQKFAEITLRGIEPANAVILVQDYHYALVPKMIRERAPAASIELFWHIPWPNPESFGICPQYKELLEGMLGADVIGFHTQFHCNNFLETCDRYLECRVDWERFSVTIGNHETLVRSYPISIATEPVARISQERKTELRAKYGIKAEHVALGVDRLDYTKGLVERVGGVERFLEKYPQYVGKFSFVEMGTPSRTNIPSYRVLVEEVESAIARVNERFGSGDYMPIILLKGHYDWNEVAEFYQLGQVCLVTSLHDGMNLVAKEYVWTQAPDQGALILSRFTGAARELSEAIIVNPYSTEEIADALFQSLNWTDEERAMRMERMKQKVQNHNAFHWATDLLAGVNAKA